MLLSRLLMWLMPLVLLPFAVEPALALTCTPRTAEDLFTSHQAAAANYVMAFGTVTPIGKRPQLNLDTFQYEPEGPYKAVFSGHLARPSGFDLPARFTITVKENCLPPWCGVLPIRSPTVIFLRMVDDGYLLETDACNGTVLTGPTDSDLKALIGCLRKGAC